jgi:predicted AAA+ superfamily ATPase
MYFLSEVKNKIKIVFSSHFHYIYNMRKKIQNKKKSISITLNAQVVKILDEKSSNRSKFIENCIIQELLRNEGFKNDLKGLKFYYPRNYSTNMN